jgi:hypothetical protein
MRKIGPVAMLYLSRVTGSKSMILMSIMGVLMAGLLSFIPFLGVPFTPITESALMSQIGLVGINTTREVPKNVLLGVVFAYTQAPALVTLFSSLAAISFISYSVGGDRLTRSFELLLAAPASDLEILYGILLAGLSYSMIVWIFSAMIFVMGSSSAILYYLGSLPSPPWSYKVQLYVLSPLMVLLTCIISISIALFAPKIIKSPLVQFGTTNPFTLISLLPLLVYVILISIPGVDMGVLAIYAVFTCAICLLVLTLLCHKLFDRRSLIT